jgi:hypothetical protein
MDLRRQACLHYRAVARILASEKRVMCRATHTVRG